MVRKIVFMAATALGVSLLSACAGPNMIQRAKVLSQNTSGITIEHSQLGRDFAFQMAADHCATFKKAAFYQGGTKQMGPDMMSTWRCE